MAKKEQTKKQEQKFKKMLNYFRLKKTYGVYRCMFLLEFLVRTNKVLLKEGMKQEVFIPF